MAKDLLYQCENSELGAQLHQLLIVEGHKEVVVQNPPDPDQVVTKDYYLSLLKNLEKAKNMSPAQRMLERKRIKNRDEITLRTAMLSADFYTVDIEDEENFGKDIHGNDIPMTGMRFVPVNQYLKGISPIDNEIGVFVDDNKKEKPVRIVGTENVNND